MFPFPFASCISSQVVKHHCRLYLPIDVISSSICPFPFICSGPCAIDSPCRTPLRARNQNKENKKKQEKTIKNKTADGSGPTEIRSVSGLTLFENNGKQEKTRVEQDFELRDTHRGKPEEMFSICPLYPPRCRPVGSFWFEVLRNPCLSLFSLF